MENINHLLRHLQTVFFGRPVNFRDERLQHRRAGRHLGHGHPRAELRGNLRDTRTHPLGDVMALRLALIFGNEVDLQIRHVRPPPHEVVTHQPIEIERRGDARVNLVIRHFRFGADGGGNFTRGLRGAFERTAFGHIQDDLKFALVVERQHLHFHPADIDQRHRDEQQHNEDAEELITPFRAGNQWRHQPAIHPAKEIFTGRFVIRRVTVSRLDFFPPLQNADGRPGRDDEGDCQ